MKIRLWEEIQNRDKEEGNQQMHPIEAILFDQEQNLTPLWGNRDENKKRYGCLLLIYTNGYISSEP